MKKNALIMLSIITLVMLSSFAIRPSEASVQNAGWINPIYRGYDDFYHQYITAYQEGSYWSLSVMILNDWWSPSAETQINISKIIVHFGWGKNYTHRFTTPDPLAYGETRVFSMSNMTPSTSEVPDIWYYDYWMYVEIVNATSGPTEVVDTWTLGRWDYYFAIYSTAHLGAQQLQDKIETFFYGGPTMFLPLNVTEAMVLYIQAYFEYQLGYQAHGRGNFSAASTHYGNAESLFDQVLSVYEQRGTAMENATLDSKKAQADANLISANAALVNSYAWMFFGIGWVLIGIGIIIYGAKKPKPA
jgi:hypothetical protein